LNGCNGGIPYNALEWVSMYGVVAADDFKYMNLTPTTCPTKL